MLCVAPAAPPPLWAVPGPPVHEKRTPTAADAHDLKIVVKLRAVPASKVPFPVEIAGFPDFSRPVPVYPAFLKYVVPVHQTMRASGEPPTAYGRYENIFLSKDEYDELQAEYPDRLERLIEEMSHYLAASGKAYQNYAAALHRWAANDKKGAVKQGIPDYTCMEGESL